LTPKSLRPTRYADHDVVGEAEPAAPVARLDPTLRIVGAIDRPSHPLGGVERATERRRGRHCEGQRNDVRICLPLQLRDLGTFIGDPVGALGLAQWHDRDKSGGIIGVGRDVVDRRHRLPDPIITPRHIGDQPTDRKGEGGNRDPAPFDPRTAEEQGERGNDQCCHTEIGRPRHQIQKGETEMPPAGTPSDRADRQKHHGDHGESQGKRRTIAQ